MNQQAQASPWRRWCQFNLATLLALLTLAGICLGRWSNSVARQREAVDAIKAAGGWVAYRHELEADQKRVEAQVPGPSWLRSLLGDHYFQTPVWLYYAGEVQATDELLAELPKLPTLERVKIEGPFTGVGLREVAELPRVTDLSIQARNLVNDDLVPLEGLKELEVLSIDAPQLTDDALIHLRGLTRLKQLTLVGNFNDAGMRHLRGLANLQEFSCTTRPHIKQLAEPTAVAFEQTPLSEAIGLLQELHHVEFRFDERSFAVAGLQHDEIAVGVKVKGTLRGTLKLMLAPHGLDWTTDSGGIVIRTSVAAERGRTEIRTLQRMHPNLKTVEIDW